MIKKSFFTGLLIATAMSGAMVLSSCSSDDVAYDENAAAKAKFAELQAKYQKAFENKYGSIASNHAWGFSQTEVSRTRAGVAEVSAFVGWDIPNDLTTGKEDKNFAKRIRQAFIDGKGVSSVDFPLTNFFMQHTCQPDDKNSIGKVYVYDSSSDKANKWVYALNFSDGKNNEENKYTNTKLKGTTLIKGFGGSGDANGKMFYYEDDEVTGGKNYEYSFYKDPETGWWFLGLKHTYTQGNGKNAKTNTTYWVIRLAEAKSTTDEVKYEGRVFCEDMGDVNGDFDFNDLVFDAQIFESGKIEISLLAAGGKYPISLAGRDVHALFDDMTMVNTGLEGHEKAPVMIEIPASEAKANGWDRVEKIPIIVSPNTTDALDYALTAEVGKAPTKICTFRGVHWAEEYVSIEKAYEGFKTWVKTNNVPENWSDNEVERYTDLILNN